MSELDDKPPEIPETTAHTDQDGDDSGSMPPPDSEVEPPNPDSVDDTSAELEHSPPATTAEESPHDSESTEDEPSAVSENDVAAVDDELHNYTESQQPTESSANDDIDGMPPLPPETDLLEPETTATPEANLEPAVEAQNPDAAEAETTNDESTEDEATTDSPGKDDKYPYRRPSGYREGVRDSVWDAAKRDDGKVCDPLTGREMSKEEPWDMGHEPGFEFRKHRDSAFQRGITRKQFLDEYNDPSHYRPELPESNRGHAGEDHTDFFGGP